MASKSCWQTPIKSLTIALTSLTLLAQGMSHLAVGEISRVAGKRGAAVESRIAVSVQPGFHVNSNTPNEDYLIPLKVKWTALGALEGGQVVYPKPSQEKYDFAEKPLSVFTGTFNLVAHFKVAPNAPAGPGAAVGKLTYQACNSTTCFPPKTVDITVPYSVE